MASKSGLSKSATIAIAVLAAVLGLVLIMVAGYFWRKKRRSSRRATSTNAPPSAEQTDDPDGPSAPEKAPNAQPVAEVKTAEFQVNELSGKNVSRSAGRTELHAPDRSDLHATARMQ